MNMTDRDQLLRERNAWREHSEAQDAEIGRLNNRLAESQAKIEKLKAQRDEWRKQARESLEQVLDMADRAFMSALARKERDQ